MNRTFLLWIEKGHTFLGFIIWLIICLLVGAVAITLAAWWRGKRARKAYRNENNWWFVLLASTAVTGVIALFNWGPPLWTSWLSDWMEPIKKFLRAITIGESVVKKIISLLEPEENPDRISWFWWKASFFVAFLTFGFFWFAFVDEFHTTIKKIKELIKEHYDKTVKERQEKAPRAENASASAPHAKLGFWEFAKWDLLVEIGEILFKTLLRNKLE